METALPDQEELTAALAAVLNRSGEPTELLGIAGRRPNPLGSTFPSEIVTCRLADGSQRQLFCKYGDKERTLCHGHRGGIRYEAEVYRQILQHLPASVPAYWGVFADMAWQRPWLVLEYLEDAVRVSEESVGMASAAAWAGRFHHLHSQPQADPRLAFLTPYDGRYYAGWVQRAVQRTGPWHTCGPWLGTLAARPEAWVALLLSGPWTVIHGEYYPHNVLVCRGRVYPIDWESAAWAAGEIDLASLTEGWPADVVGHCERAYCQARWPQGPPADFERRLAAARLYLAFRWLGDLSERVDERSALEYVAQLRAAGERLGLL